MPLACKGRGRKGVAIDIVLARPNNNVIFLQFICFKFQDLSQNYNRAIDIPEYVIPDCVEEYRTREGRS
jgi:hypothetical protein